MRALGASRTSVVPGGALAGGWTRNPLWKTARAVPSLDLRFADNKSLGDAVGGGSLVTFTRASSGTFVGSDGVLRTAVTNEPRFDHNPTTGESLGLLVEEARTNFAWPSADYSGANWIRSNIQVSAATTTAPDSSTCFGYEGSSASSLLKRLRFNFATTTVGTYTWSIYLKAGTEDSCAITIQDGTGVNGANATILLTNGTVTTAASNTGVNTGAAISVQAASNGFYRVSLTSTFVAALTQIQSIITWDVNGLSTTTGTLFPWGAQLEAGAFATSYIPTTSATATRSADVASITAANFSSWYNQTEGTLFAQTQVAGYSSTTNPDLVGLVGANSVNDRIVMFLAGAGPNYRASISTRGVAQFLQNVVSLANIYDANNFAIAYKENDSVSFGRNANTTDTLVTLPVITSLNFNASGSATKYIKRLTYWPTRLANTTLQSITQ